MLEQNLNKKPCWKQYDAVNNFQNAKNETAHIQQIQRPQSDSVLSLEVATKTKKIEDNMGGDIIDNF